MPRSPEEIVLDVLGKSQEYFKLEEISMPGGNFHIICLRMVRAGEENERLKHEQKCDHEWESANEIGVLLRTTRYKCKKCGMEVPF